MAISYKYITVEELNTFAGYIPDSNVESSIDNYIIAAGMLINQISGNQINATGLSNFTENQQINIKTGVALLVSWFASTGESWFNKNVSISQAGVSISQSANSELNYLPQFVYDALQQSGLYLKRMYLDTYNCTNSTNDYFCNQFSSSDLPMSVTFAYANFVNYEGFKSDTITFTTPLNLNNRRELIFNITKDNLFDILYADNNVANQLFQNVDGEISFLYDTTNKKITISPDGEFLTNRVNFPMGTSVIWTQNNNEYEFTINQTDAYWTTFTQDIITSCNNLIYESETRTPITTIGQALDFIIALRFRFTFQLFINYSYDPAGSTFGLTCGGFTQLIHSNNVTVGNYSGVFLSCKIPGLVFNPTSMSLGTLEMNIGRGTGNNAEGGFIQFKVNTNEATIIPANNQTLIWRITRQALRDHTTTNE